MKNLITIAAFGLAAAGLGGCNQNDAQEEAVESQAGAVRDTAEQPTETLEERADDVDTSDDGMAPAAEQELEEAEALRERGERESDLEEKADMAPR